MRIGLLLAVTYLLTSGIALGANESVKGVPYSATVSRATVLRSGPGEDYYVTTRLPAGTALEVYQHHGSWYAVRPIEESFSWVANRYLRLTGDGFAQVTRSGLVCRVGSNVSTQRNVVQIRLQKGERVELFDPSEFIAEKRSRWVRVYPPAGEFRWVAQSDIRSDAGLIKQDTSELPPQRSSDAQSLDQTRNAFLAPSDNLRDEASREGVQVINLDDLEREDSDTNGAPGANRGVGKNATFGDTLSPKSRAGAKVYSSTASESSEHQKAGYENRPALLSTGTESQLGDINLQLSQIVLDSPLNWQLTKLRYQVEELLSTRGNSSSDLSRANALLGRIRRFESIKERVLAMRDAATPQVAQPQGLSRNIQLAANFDVQFDAQGKLKQVISKRKDAPKFALTDAAGDVVCFVSPAKGVNLENYVGRQLGVVGRRGFLTRYGKRHVLAERIALLESRFVN